MAKNNYIGTPHIGAKKGEFPKTILFPGDPLRAKWIAETFLENTKKITEIRGMLGYIGVYKGVEIGVMASGMGIPSAGIYSYELFDFYDVDNIIRIGTCGGYKSELSVGGLIIGSSAYSESTYAMMMKVETDKPKIMNACPKLLKLVVETAKDLGIDYKKGLIHTSDAFYGDSDQNEYKAMGIDVVEMEAFAIYTNAKKLGKRALAIMTISDNIITGENMSPIERQTQLETMIKLGLEAAIRYERENDKK